MENPACHLYFLGIHTCLKARVYTKKMHVTCRIFHGIQPNSVAQLVCTCILYVHVHQHVLVGYHIWADNQHVTVTA